MKKILTLILVLVLTFTLLSVCGCGDKKTDGDSASSPANSGNFTFTKDTLKLADDNGKAIFKIIRPEAAEKGIVFDASGKLFREIRDKLGYSIQNTADSSDGSNKYEILVGHTNRPESQFALDYINKNLGGRYDDYIVCTVGKKIVINGTNDTAVANAVDYFIKNHLDSHTIKGGIEYTHKTEGEFTDITVNGKNIKEFKIVRPLYNVSYLTQRETEVLYDYIRGTTGYEAEIVKDGEFAESECEIIVGDSTRAGVTKHDKNDMDGFSVKISGNKVYLNGGSTYATAAAVTEFCSMLKDGKAEDSESVITGSYASVKNKYDLTTYYTPVWQEDFKSYELDTSKWMHVPWSADGQNGKKSRRSQETYSFDGEYFTIAPYQTETEYHGGMLRTHRAMNFLYGYVEESAKLPSAKGFWSALWTGASITSGVGENEEAAATHLLGCEIDINENFGGNYIAANCHSWPTELGEQNGYKHTSCDNNEMSNDKKFSLPAGVDMHDDFHTYGMLWTPTYMSFTADGEIFFTYDTTKTEQDQQSFNQQMFLTLSLAVGLKSGSTSIGLSTEEDWAKRSSLVVDYVHLYQLQDGKSQLDLVPKVK